MKARQFMRRISLFLALLGICATAPALAEWEALVVDIFDGDTLIVSVGGRAEIIRLFGIDCPEKMQSFGLEARDFTSGMVAGRTISVTTRGEKRYRLCKVYVGEKCLNEELLKAGYAWHQSRYSSDKNWAEMEQIARSAGTGLWSEPAPVAPWEFRASENRQTIQRSHRIRLQSKHKTGTVAPTKPPSRSIRPKRK